MRSNFLINLPKNIKIIVLSVRKNNYKKIIFLNKTKKMVIVYKNDIIFDKWSNSLILLKYIKNNDKLRLENKLNIFLNSLNIYFYSKIKFKGKGFRIKFFKKIKILKFYFGKSHKTFLFLKKINKKKINKYKFIISGLNKTKINLIKKIICNIKPINVYTLRGLRLSRQIIFKRKGKKGTYI